MPRDRLTPELQTTIVAYIRAGAFLQVAAEAAGVPFEVFRGWLARGASPRARPLYRALARAVRQAQAQARLSAEVAMHSDRPLDWLRSGPGRDVPNHPGWTAPVRPSSTASAVSSPLTDPRFRDFLSGLLASLEGHPEARAHLAAWIEQDGVHCLPFVS